MNNQEKNRALEAVEKYGSLLYPVGVDRAALCHAAVVLAGVVKKLEAAVSSAHGAIQAARVELVRDRRGPAGDLFDAAFFALDAALGSEESRIAPMPMVLYCPAGHQHIDEGEWATNPHRTHQCQHKKWMALSVNEGGENLSSTYEICGLEWRPANVPTVGVQSIENKETTPL